ncbi:acyltransferase [Flavobacterium granuli]|uniref:Peptidoglycan/LPS O-acetylase OafA/YrhL n=1 Tax=Flavobacterium granuli TaxID=280093 RepID=A0ABU1S5S8_9FLAO|nr:acyltransferase [Flavobacterium granuli]MDR6846399.1 peptidoglycan/LPS O-acetylase OafA/YrhL [Flavobacterium granuli]
MKLSFKRITAKASFIPEIDGLRFIAITSVILYHFHHFLVEKDNNQYYDDFDYSFLHRILEHGFLGVPLFFVISGFILALPFANEHLNNGNKVLLKNYFLKRLTRLEPPYIIVMTLLLLGSVYVAKTFTISDGIASYLSSIFYLNNFIYPNFTSTLNVVTWSLEIEVQFYILAPLLACTFLIKKASNRRSILSCVAVILVIFNQLYSLPYLSLIKYFQYFIIGFLLADLYVSNYQLLPKTKIDYLIGVFLFCFIWLFDVNDFNSIYSRIIFELAQLSCIFLFYYYVLFHKIFRFLSFKLITNIGGMCYSIYLLHYPIISLIGNNILNYTFSKYSYINTFIYISILIFAIGIISSCFFLLIERPCMDKDWYKKIARRIVGT